MLANPFVSFYQGLTPLSGWDSSSVLKGLGVRGQQPSVFFSKSNERSVLLEAADQVRAPDP